MSVAPLQLLKSEFNPLVYVALDNATDKFVSLAYYYGATTTTPSDAYFTKGALLVHATDGTTYQNTAADGATPTWTALGGGGGGIAIGDTVTGSNKNRILFIDGGTELTDDANFTRQVDGQTIFSSTFGTDVVSFQMADNVLGLTGFNGIGTKVENTAGESIQNISANNGGGLLHAIGLAFTDGSQSGYNIIKGSFDVTIKGTTTDNGRFTLGVDEIDLVTKVGSNNYGFLRKTDTTRIGQVVGSGGTYIEVDHVLNLIKMTNVPTYADETTAIGAGLTTGQVYKSFDGQNYFLAIVH